MFNLNNQIHVEHHRRELRRNADHYRLAHQATRAQAPSKPVVQRLLAAVGRHMVQSGHYLLNKGEARRIQTSEWEQISRALS